MKHLKFFVFIIVIMLFSYENVYAAKNPYKSTTKWGTNCTWSTWNETYERTKVALPGFGDARDWYKDAKNAGFSVGSEPKPNSIIVLDNFKNYGHVAFVDSVKNDSIFVWDSVPCYREMTKEEHDTWWDCVINNTTSADDMYKCDHLKVLEEVPCEYSKENGKLEKLVGYIYVTEPRKNSSKNDNISSDSKNTVTKEEEKNEVKSNNNYLSELKIENLNLYFDKEVLEYNLEVPYETANIKIGAKAEDDKAILTMDNEIKLEVGVNKINILVTAEDKSTRNYVVNIKRLDKIEKVLDEKIDGDNKKVIIIIVSSVIILGVIGFVLKKK